MLYSLKKYMSGKDFAPQQQIDIELVKNLLSENVM